MTENIINIAIADDHSLFASGMASLLNDENGFIVSIIAENGQELLNMLEKKPLPDVLLLDIEMPVMDGFETLEHLQEDYPQIKIIVLSMYNEYSFIKKMLVLGVSGYLLKNANPVEVINAIKSVADDGLAYNQEAMSVMRNLINRNEKPLPLEYDFSDRELDIIRLVCEEKTSAEIAGALYLSKSSIDATKRDICQKMGVKTSVGMIAYAIRHNIID